MQGAGIYFGSSEKPPILSRVLPPSITKYHDGMLIFSFSLLCATSCNLVVKFWENSEGNFMKIEGAKVNAGALVQNWFIPKKRAIIMNICTFFGLVWKMPQFMPFWRGGLLANGMVYPPPPHFPASNTRIYRRRQSLLFSGPLCWDVPLNHSNFLPRCFS
jgi:hypothetical protein